MSSAMITLIGLYNYDPSLFDDIKLPDGLDHDTLRDVILLNCGEFEPLYPDWGFMAHAIRLFFDHWFFTFDKWQRAIEVEYDPLNNYDRYEETEDNTTGTENGTFTNTTNSSSSGTNEKKKSAYDSSSYQPYDQDLMSGQQDENGIGSSDTQKEQKYTHKAHLYGNIGVTTSQQMLEQELDVARWNIYEQIADIFKTELTLFVY